MLLIVNNIYIAGIESQIFELAESQGILGLYLPSNESIFDLFDSVGIVEEKKRLLLSDVQFGFGSSASFCVWVRAAKEGSQGKTAKFLFDYFHLIFTKGDALLKSLKTNLESIDAILKNYYCANSTVECDNRYLTAMQWTSQGVTKYPPGGVNGTESVITGNTTAEGFPELSLFHREYFLKKVRFKLV